MLVQCPQCHFMFDIDENVAGKSLVCKQCDNQFVVGKDHRGIHECPRCSEDISSGADNPKKTRSKAVFRWRSLLTFFSCEKKVSKEKQ